MKAILAAVLLIAAANAAAITWTGFGNDMQWNNKVNWNTDTVPGEGDDVTISSGVVQITTPVAVNSLQMGDSFSASANLTLFSSLFIGSGGMQVQGNGNVMLPAGTSSLQGQVTVGGNLYFQSGSMSGAITITSRGVLDMSGGAEKTLTGCQLSTSATSVALQGVFVLNQSSVFTASAGTIVASGDVSIQAQDSTVVLFDTSAATFKYTGGGDLQLMAPVKLGAFNFVAGNLTLFDTINFVNALSIPSGSYVSTVGSSVANLSAGVSGAGVLSAAGSSLTLGATTVNAVNLVGGNVTFAAAGSDIPILTFSGGNGAINFPVKASQLNLLNGNLNGVAAVTAKQLYLSSQGFNLNGAVTVSSQASLGGLIAFGSTGALTIGATATANAYASLTFTGVSGMTVTNNGVVTAASPIVFQGINLAGNGNLTAGATVSFQTSTVAQTIVTLQSSGVVKGANTRIAGFAAIKAPTSVKATIGSYSFSCPLECDNVVTSTFPTNNFRFSA